jgi:hypothetical protein
MLDMLACIYEVRNSREQGTSKFIPFVGEERRLQDARWEHNLFDV